MDALSILKYGQGTVLKTLEGLPQQHWETGGVCGWWSVKNILSHLASYEHILVDILTAFPEMPDAPAFNTMLQNPQSFNDILVEPYLNKPVNDVMDDFTTTFEKTLELGAKIAPEMWAKNGTLAWYGDAYSLDDFIVYTYYGHKREHSAQIAVFCDSLAR